MATMNRRHWGRVVVGGMVGAGAQSLLAQQTVPAKPRINSAIAGVPIGVQSYSFRALTLDESVKAMAALGIGLCELWQGHLEPQELAAADKREDLRAWRMNTPLETFGKVRTRFEEAGLGLLAYNFSFRNDFTDAEIERGFLMAQTLGVSLITSSAQTEVVPRLLDFARQYNMRVALHNHSKVAEGEFATPDDFAAALKLDPSGNLLGVNLDLGHFVAAGFDCLAYLRQHHQRVLCLHLKDRKRDQGANVPWGEGDTPLRAVLQEVRDRKWKIPSMIEYEYEGQDPIVEVRRCLDFCKSALGA
jgi:sugar phosphate isomerase/epimerase